MQHVGGVFAQRLAAGVDDDELRAALRRLFEIGGGNGMVLGRIGADDNDHVGVLDLVECRGHRAGADALDQGRDRRSVAEPRAVIDIIVVEARADQFLEQIGLFVGAFGRAEAGDGAVAVGFGDPRKTAGGEVQRLLPARLKEMRVGIRGIDIDALGQSGLADEGLHQPLRIGNVIESEPAFDAQAVLIGEAVAALNEGDLVVLDLVRDLTADAAIGADRVDFAVHFPAAVLGDGIDDRFRHQRAGGTGLHAFPAGDAGRLPHRVVEIEHGPRVDAAEGHADHVVDLHFAAGTHAESAIDAGIEIDGHRRVRKVGFQDAVGGEARRLDTLCLGPVPELGHPVGGIFARRLIGKQELHDHATRLHRPLARRLHHHVRRRLADARGGQHALALDLDHASAAVAVGAVARLGQPAEMRNVDSFALGDLPYGLARAG